MIHRDRSTGWKHAKLSGHENEERIKNLLDNNAEYAKDFLKRINHQNEIILETSIGGLHETEVPSVLDQKKTKSKTDLKVFLNNKTTLNISIKKSLGGQVYFVRAGLFIQTFEKQFNKVIPTVVKRAICLFWAAADDSIEIINNYGDKTDVKNYNMQLRHKSINATTLKKYNDELYNAMLKWFIENASEIALLSFSMGAVGDKSEWSHLIWYKNMLDENDIDALFAIEDLCLAVKECAAKDTFYSTKNGGTTIQLPFGFVQWHQEQMQFHHSYNKILNLQSKKST